MHCVIIGFVADLQLKERKIYFNDSCISVNYINGYLLDAPNIAIVSRKKPLCKVPEMVFESMPNDDRHLSDYSDEQKNEIISKYPQSAQFF